MFNHIFRISIVTTSNRQNDTINLVLRDAAKAVVDFASQQAEIYSALDMAQDPLPHRILELLQPDKPSNLAGYKAVEEDYGSWNIRCKELDEFIKLLRQPDGGPLSLRFSTSEDGSESHDTYDLLHQTRELIRQLSSQWASMSSEITRLLEQQAKLGEEMQSANLHVQMIRNKVETIPPEVRNVSQVSSRVFDLPFSSCYS